MKIYAAKSDCEFLWQRVDLILAHPHLFSPPVGLEFSLCALLDGLEMLGRNEDAGTAWRVRWEAERSALHGFATDRFLSDPVGIDRSVLLTYALPSLLTQSYRQVVSGAQKAFNVTRNALRSDPRVSTDGFQLVMDSIGALIEEALSNPDAFSQPAGLECYLIESIAVFEVLLQPHRKATVLEAALEDQLKSLSIDVPLHVRQLRDVLSIDERSKRERAIPPGLWEQAQAQVVRGFRNIIQNIVK